MEEIFSNLIIRRVSENGKLLFNLRNHSPPPLIFEKLEKQEVISSWPHFKSHFTLARTKTDAELNIDDDNNDVHHHHRNNNEE